MNGRIRAAGVAAGVVLCLTLASSSPMLHGGSGAPAGPGDPPAVSVGLPDPSASSQPVVVPAVGAVAPNTALKELWADDDRPLIDFDAAGNVVGMTAPPGGSIPNPAGDGTDGFVRRYAGAFGLNSSYAAVQTSSRVLPGGDTVTRYQQTSGGVSVLGGEIVITADAQGQIKGVVAEATQATPTATTAAIPGLDPDQTYRVSVVQVTRLARTRPIDFMLSQLPPLNCPSVPPQFLVICTPPRTHRTPLDTCGVYTPTRRSG